MLMQLVVERISENADIRSESDFLGGIRIRRFGVKYISDSIRIRHMTIRVFVKYSTVKIWMKNCTFSCKFQENFCKKWKKKFFKKNFSQIFFRKFKKVMFIVLFQIFLYEKCNHYEFAPLKVDFPPKIMQKYFVFLISDIRQKYPTFWVSDSDFSYLIFAYYLGSL